MKKALQKLSAAFLALTMIVSITPMTAFTLLADETETGAPAATEETESEKKEPSGKSDAGKQKETEKPAEKTPEDTKKPEADTPKETEKPEAEKPEETEPAAPAETTEAPKETEKEQAPSETEAPKETDKPDSDTPAETEAPSETEAPKETDKSDADTPAETEEPKAEEPKEPEDSDSKEPKDETGTIKFTGITADGILEWEPYDDENLSYYQVFIIQDGNEYGEYADTNSFELYAQIDYLIRRGTIQNQSKYSIKIAAYDEDDNLLAAFRFAHIYNSKAVYKPAGSFTATITNGILTWGAYPDDETDHYWIYIQDEHGHQIDQDEYVNETEYSRDLKADIDRAIKGGALEKSNSYKISMVAEDDHGIALGKWSGTTFVYDSPATLIVEGEIKNAALSQAGILTWDAYANTEEYDISILIDEDDSFCIGSTSKTSFELGSEIDSLIRNRVLEKTGKYTITIVATDEDGFRIASTEKTFTYESTAEPIQIGAISASISKTGVLTWNNYEGAVEYDVLIKSGDDSYSFDFSSTDVLSVNLNAWIDRLIKAGVFEKKSPYEISITAFNNEYTEIGNWKESYSYQSKAEPTEPGHIAAGISEGVLTWQAFTGAVSYEVTIDDDWGSTYSWPTPVNINKKIDVMIKDGSIRNKESYVISIEAYDDYGFKIAGWCDTYAYNSSAAVVKPGKISGIAFENGRMTWTAYEGAADYSVSIGETFHDVFVQVTTFKINEEIDQMIRAGELKKKSSYNVSVSAYDSDGILIAEGHKDYSYDSSAEPYVVGVMNAKITNGILTWEKYEGASMYSVYIDGNGSSIEGDSYDVNKRIDWLIKAGETSKQTSYEVAIAAEDEHGTALAYWSTDYAYNSSASLVKPGKITGVKFAKGNMTWTAYKNAVNYMVYVYDCPVYSSKNSVAIDSKIDWYIKAGQIIKSSSYPVTILAYDKEDIVIAEWNGEYKYNSTAVPFELTTVTGISVSPDGVMSWDKVLNAGEYNILVDDCYIHYSTKGSSCDLSGFIADLINTDFLDKQNSYIITIKALTADSILLAEGTCTCSFTAGTDISDKVTVTGIKDLTYNGKALEQNPVIVYNGQQLVRGTDYEIYYWSNKDAGTAEMTISFRHKYIGAYNSKFEIKQAKNPLAVKGKTYKVKAKKIKKKALSVSVSSVVKFVKNAGDPKIYKKKSGNKKIVINAKTGLITIKKKLKKGTYKVKVQITGQGNNNYEKSGTKTVTFKIKVK